MKSDVLGCACIALSAILIVAPLSATNPYDTNAIIERSVEANAADWKAAPEYDFFERDQESGHGTKTYEDLMISGSPYERLIAINGEPLSPEQQAQVQRELEATIVHRRNESTSERAERIEKYETDRKRDQMLMDQLTKALDFTFLGQQKLDGHNVYVLKATPRPGYQPPTMETEVLTAMHGKLWIDEKTFQWVKVEAQVLHPVSIEGFLAQVEPGTRFELDKMPVEDDVWLPKHFAMKSQARILFLFSKKSQADETYYGYHKARLLQGSWP